MLYLSDLLINLHWAVLLGYFVWAALLCLLCWALLSVRFPLLHGLLSPQLVISREKQSLSECLGENKVLMDILRCAGCEDTILGRPNDG